ncbi:M81 family metallopeptidase [Nitratireductor soli]|uniref:M81 family metallopeptidase n=1 Tax=Nitratireductor soli TaxID=1670619 RepID=UPI00065E2289|nr:M81 family metallopeptidase [Nitratireductor soli]
MKQRPRIFFAGFFHETHTFVEECTTATDFDVRRGDDLLARRGDASTVDGFLEVAGENDWDLVASVEYVALPSGMIDHAVFEQFWRAFEADLRQALGGGRLDGIWLALHGAAVTDRCDDLEGEFLRRIRNVAGAGHLPVFGVFDLHATFTETMAVNANGLVCYRENPHTDAREAAVRSARLLARCLEDGTTPRMKVRNLPLMWPPTGTGTADDPMKELEARAREIERQDASIWAINVVAGFSFSDVRDAGVAISLVTEGDDAAADIHLQTLADLAMALRERGLPREWDLDAALRAIGNAPGPSIIVEPADNIGGGAPGDCTAVLRGLLRHGMENSAVVIADPEAVASLQDAKPGEVRRLRIGGKRSSLDEGPVEVSARLVRLSDGAFRLEDLNSHLAAAQGATFDMGPCAVVVADDTVTVLLTSRKTPPFDLGQLRSQGITPEQLSVIGVKAAVAHRRAYDRIAAASYTVSTPGPCASNLRTLPYRKLRRPIYPLDPI